MTRKNRIPKEDARREKIREVLQMLNIGIRCQGRRAQKFLCNRQAMTV